MVARVTPTDERWRVPWRLGLATAFIVAQFVMILIGLGLDTRFYTWSPHDQRTAFVISVTIDGRELTEPEVLARYGRSQGVDPRATGHVLRVVSQYESTYGRDDNAEVTIRYSVNGGEQQVWEWPR